MRVKLLFQAKVCLPKGLECYKKNVKVTTDACLTPCEGVYAGVEKHEGAKQDIVEKLTDVIQEYREYKSGFYKGTEG